MITSWIDAILSAVAMAWNGLNGLDLFAFLRDLKSFEPRAWLILMTVFLAVGGLTTFVHSTQFRMASTRRRFRRFDSAWDHRLDGE